MWTAPPKKGLKERKNIIKHTELFIWNSWVLQQLQIFLKSSSQIFLDWRFSTSHWLGEHSHISSCTHAMFFETLQLSCMDLWRHYWKPGFSSSLRKNRIVNKKIKVLEKPVEHVKLHGTDIIDRTTSDPHLRQIIVTWPSHALILWSPLWNFPLNPELSITGDLRFMQISLL